MTALRQRMLDAPVLRGMAIPLWSTTTRQPDRRTSRCVITRAVKRIKIGNKAQEKLRASALSVMLVEQMALATVKLGSWLIEAMRLPTIHRLNLPTRFREDSNWPALERAPAPLTLQNAKTRTSVTRMSTVMSA